MTRPLPRRSKKQATQTPLIATVLSLFNLIAFRSWLSFLQSSNPSHLWSSSMRCLLQWWPPQKPQSPTMRCAASLQSLKEHRIFFAGMPPRRGRAMCRVALGGMAYSDSVVDDEHRCLPAWTMRTSEGVATEVRSARRDRNVDIEVLGGRVRGIAMWVVSRGVWFRISECRGSGWNGNILFVPETVLTKICIVSSLSDMAELMLEMLDVRCMMM